MEEATYAAFNFQTAKKNLIKVIGVGGGGGNAVNHMYEEGIQDVSFVVCNTDAKALEDSPVPVKLQLGHEGLGAGNRPEKGREATQESIDEVKAMLGDGTKMTFITAGMGGGTGTGAGPLVAKLSKEMGILTVGIVTIPFRFEGNLKIDQALDGVEEMSKNVDALLVVNNERLLEIYQEKTLTEAFKLADDTLCNAARSISEIITMHGNMNLDFQDVTTMLKDGGVAIMSTGFGSGDSRVSKAIDDALHSPLLNDNDVYHSKKVLLHVVEPGPEGEAPLRIEEINEITEFMDRMQDENLETKWGHSYNPELKDQVKITILASGFGIKDIHSKEMDKRISDQMEKDHQMELARIEEEEKKRERREKIYGSNGKSGYLRHAVYDYIFNDEDLDDDDLISSVESSPTGTRQKNKLTEFMKRSVAQESAPAEGEPIVFDS